MKSASDRADASRAAQRLVAFLNLSSVRRDEPLPGRERRELAEILGTQPESGSKERLDSLRAVGAALRALVSSGADEERAAYRLNQLLAARPVTLRATRGGLRALPATEDTSSAAIDVLMAAASLIQAGEWDRLRQCSGCDCIFFDTSRNGLRVWCSMDTCGNRAKVSSWRHRVRSIERAGGCACAGTCHCGARTAAYGSAKEDE